MYYLFRDTTLGGFSASHSAHIKALRQGLRELGYVEGEKILIEYRYAEGKRGRRTALAAELAGLKVEVIITSGSTSTRAAKSATTTIPIVMAQDPDPVGNGFVASLARPGGNITGLSNLGPQLSGKRLELLKELVPKLSRVAVFGDSNFPGNAQGLKEAELAARALALQLQYLDVRSHKDLDTLFRAASRDVLTHSSCLVAPRSAPSEHKLQRSPRRAGCRRFGRENMPNPVGS